MRKVEESVVRAIFWKIVRKATLGMWRVDLRGPNGLRGEKDEWEERVCRLRGEVKRGGCGHSHTVFRELGGRCATVTASVARKAGARGHGVPRSGQTQGCAGRMGWKK